MAVAESAITTRSVANFRENLGLVQRFKDKSQKEFALELGISKYKLSRQLDDQQFTLDDALDYCERLAISIDLMLGEKKALVAYLLTLGYRHDSAGQRPVAPVPGTGRPSKKRPPQVESLQGIRPLSSVRT